MILKCEGGYSLRGKTDKNQKLRSTFFNVKELNTSEKHLHILQVLKNTIDFSGRIYLLWQA